MNLFILSITLLGVLLLAIYGMTRGAAIDAEINRLTRTKSPEEIWAEFQAIRGTLNLYVVGGILLTGAFALMFFGAGGIDPRHWTLENGIYAVIGMTATVAITLGQRMLYSSVSHNKTALLVTVLILTFVIFSEVATSSEREDSIVRDRSLNSPTLQAVLGRLNQPDELPPSNAGFYQSEAARYQSLANQSEGNSKRANEARAAEYQAKADAEAVRMQLAITLQCQTKGQLVQEGSALECVEHNHSAIVRWLREISASSYNAAMMFAALIFVIAFESGFHFSGTRAGILSEVLSRMGYAVTRRKTPALPKLATPAPTPTGSLHGRVGESDTGSLHGRVGDALAAYDEADRAEAGEHVSCPQCGTPFKKRNKQHRFCNPKCKDAWHNTQNPERAAVAAKRGRVTA